MRTRNIPAALGSAVLAVALTACGSSSPDSAEPGADGDSPGGGSASADGSAGPEEPITTGGVALIVTDHLGDKVRRVGTYGTEPGSVSVMVELRDKTPHNFAVSVHSPEQAGELGQAGKCPPRGQLGPDAECRVLDNGTAVMTGLTPYGFSDDNEDGIVVMGTAVTEGNGASMAMYESYDDSPTVSTSDIEAMLADERLGWLTDPEVNRAGEDVPVKKLTG
jgi:hypothetical protein